MSEKFRLDRKIGFQNTFYPKCINVIIDSIGPSIILRSIYTNCFHHKPKMADMPIYGKTPIKSPPEHTGNSLGLIMYQ